MPESDSWVVDWPNISTPGELLLLMSTQLTPQLDIAMRAGEALLSGEGVKIQNVSEFLAAASSAASFLWPSPSRNRRLAEAFPRRADDLRHLLGISSEQPHALYRIRNDLTHVDERLEELFLEDPHLSMVAWGESADVAVGTKVYMSFDSESGTLHSLGEEIKVSDLVDWFRDLVRRFSRIWGNLLFRMHEIGREPNEI